MGRTYSWVTKIRKLSYAFLRQLKPILKRDPVKMIHRAQVESSLIEKLHGIQQKKKIEFK